MMAIGISRASASPAEVPPYTTHEFRSPRGVLLGGVFVYPLEHGGVRYEVLRMVHSFVRVAVTAELVNIAEGEAPSEAEAVRVARFLVER